MPLTSASLPGHTDKWFTSDLNFHHLYPIYIQELAKTHRTPLRVVKKASGFLSVNPGAKILDIGSGAGKFGIGGADYNRCGPIWFVMPLSQKR